MDSVNYARAASQPTIITIQLTQSSLMHGIGYVLLYKALAAGDNYYTLRIKCPDTIISLTAFTKHK